MQYLKKASRAQTAEDTETRRTVQELLSQLEANGEAAVRRCNEKFDGWTGDVLVPHAEFQRAAGALPQTVKDDLVFARDRVRDFARRQRDSLQEFDMELAEGLVAGQRSVPVETAGCYVLGG